MRRRFLLFGLAGLSMWLAVPREAHAQAPEVRSPTYQFSVRALDTAPPPRIAHTAPTLATRLGATAPAIPPPRFDLLWSKVLDRAVADLKSLTDVSANALSAIFQPGAIDTVVPARPDPFIPSNAPKPAPLGIQIRMVHIEPVAVITPEVLGAEIRGQEAILPTAQLDLPWMIP